MADTFLSALQSNPQASTLTILYTASAATVISSITICNTGGTPATFSISIAVAGAADILSQYIYYKVPIPPNSTFIATVGISLLNTDLIRVWASSPLLSFNAFGVTVA